MPRRAKSEQRRGPLGLLAGAGMFPVCLAQAARRVGTPVYCVGVAGMAPESLRALCAGFDWVRLGQVGRAVKLFRRAGVQRAVMAGKIHKTLLFSAWRFWHLLPDWGGLRVWYQHASRDKRDDTLLTAVIHEFERNGIMFGSALDDCPELLVHKGFLTRRKPSPAQWRDIRFGWALAKEMGRLDVGQSVCVKETAVLAVEAIEGTDAAIRRAGELCRQGGFTAVKVAKPHQDMRFDVPTVGVQTVQTLAESGGKVLAIEADRTIVLDQENVVRLADRLGIAIVAIDAAEVELRLTA